MADTNSDQAQPQAQTATVQPAPSKIEADIQKVEAEAKGVWNWIKAHSVLVAALGGLLAGFIAGLLV